jgi:hypothetical protein
MLGRQLFATVGVGIAMLASVGAAITQAAGPLNLRHADWDDVSVPGSVCGTSETVKLHNWSAIVRSNRWPSFPRVDVAGVDHLVYGDLVPGSEAAAMQVSCSNLGGTAAGQLAFAVVVYVAGETEPQPVGVLAPRQLSKAGVHAPLLEPISITPGNIIVEQFSYGPQDGDCCPSGRAKTDWAYSKGSFRSISTVVERQPTK